MCLEDGVEIGKTGAHRLRATAEAGEEVRLDETGDDPQIGLHVTTVDAHHGCVDVTHVDVIVVGGTVVVHAVAGEDGGADESRHLGRGGPSVRPGGAEQLDSLRSGTEALELREQWREHGAIGHRARDVGEDDDDLPRSFHQSFEWRSAGGRAQRSRDGALLVHQGGRVVGLDHGRRVRDLDVQPGDAIGKVDGSHPGSPFAPSASPRMASATRSAVGRIAS